MHCKASHIFLPFFAAPTTKEKGNVAAQMLMLYYVLLYENVRLSHMKSILVSGRKVIRHSHDILSELPIKFLLQTAERDQDRFGGLYPQLLRLCSTHFPHLCMVQDTLMSDSLEVSEDRIHCNHLSSTKGTSHVQLSQEVYERFLESKNPLFLEF